MITPEFNKRKKFVRTFIPRPSRLRNLASLMSVPSTVDIPEEMPTCVYVPKSKIECLQSGQYFVRDGYLQNKAQQAKNEPAPEPSPTPTASAE